MTRHLNISPLHRRDHARATTPPGTCIAAAEGLDVETFRGFQLAGELFLLTSFFIEPSGRKFESYLTSQIYPLRVLSAFWLTAREPAPIKMANTCEKRLSPYAWTTGPIGSA